MPSSLTVVAFGIIAGLISVIVAASLGSCLLIVDSIWDTYIESSRS